MEQARASRIMRFSQPHDRGGSPVPAERSSSIPSGLTALGHADRLRSAETPHLLAYLATSPTQGPAPGAGIRWSPF
jgi:hypothetical protein